MTGLGMGFDLSTKPPLGTHWTLPGEGNDLATLLKAANEPIKPGDDTRATDLVLAGEPLTDQDKQRICHLVNVRSIGSYKVTVA